MARWCLAAQRERGTSDPDAEFEPAAGQSLVMIPLVLEAANSHHGA
jgi:hypothetical protein